MLNANWRDIYIGDERGRKDMPFKNTSMELSFRKITIYAVNGKS